MNTLYEYIKSNPGKKIHELITKDTWCQGRGCELPDGTLTNDDRHLACKMCLTYWIGALYGDLTPEWDNARSALFEKIKGVPAFGHSSIGLDIIWWNDHKERTFEDVHSLLKELDI